MKVSLLLFIHYTTFIIIIFFYCFAYAKQKIGFKGGIIEITNITTDFKF